MLIRSPDVVPNLELERGQTPYSRPRSIISTGFAEPVNINTQVHPGYENVLTLTPTETGQFSIICNEYCGIGHHQMAGRIYVVDKK